MNNKQLLPHYTTRIPKTKGNPPRLLEKERINLVVVVVVEVYSVTRISIANCTYITNQHIKVYIELTVGKSRSNSKGVN